MGLLSAAKKYDDSKGLSFVSFACKKIRQEIISFVRQKRQRKFKYSNAIDDVETHSRASVQDEYEAEYDDEDERAYVRRAVSALAEPHRQFAEIYYLEGLSVKEFQKATAMNRHRIFQLRKQTLALLRVQMAHG